MNWFFRGIELSDERFAALKLDFQLNRRSVETHLDDLLLCWAKAFFQVGYGHTRFWPALVEGVFANRLPDGCQLQAFQSRVKDVVRRRFHLSAEGGIRAWFFEYCWLVSGTPNVDGDRPRGRTSEMIRDVLDLDDELQAARLRGLDCQTVVSEQTERLGKLANTLNVPELRDDVIGALGDNVTGDGVCHAHELVREAVRRFREDAECNNSITTASCGWFLAGSRVSGYRLVLRFSFKPRFVEAARGRIISICDLQSAVSATGVADFDGWDILSRFRDNPEQIRWTIDGGLNLPRKKDVVAGLRCLLAAESGNRAVCFVESSLSENHRIADSDAQKEDDPIPQVVSRAILAVTHVSLVQDIEDGTRELLPFRQGEDMIVARHVALDLAGDEPRKFSRYNTILWYRGRYDAAIYEGEEDDLVLYIKNDGGKERLHAFSGARLICSSQGARNTFEAPAERDRVLFFDRAVVYVPPILAEAVAGGQSARESNWEYAAERQDEKSVRLNGGRVGVLHVDGREISVLKVIRFEKPLMWLEDATAQEYPTGEVLGFSSCGDLRGWRLRWIPSNDGFAASRQVLRFEYGDGGWRRVPLSDGVSIHGIHEVDLAQDWRQFRGTLPQRGSETDRLCLKDGAEACLLLTVRVEPTEMSVWPSDDGDGVKVYSPSADQSHALLVMSAKALDEEGSLQDQERLHTYRLLEPGFGLECGGVIHVGAGFCEDNEFPEANAVYAIALDVNQAVEVLSDFSAFRSVSDCRWHLVRRSRQAVKLQFENYERVSERLGLVLPPDAARRQPESFSCARVYCDSIEHDPLLLKSCWQRHLANGDSIRDTLRSLLDGANPVNIFACPEPCQYQRIGWRCKTWLHSVAGATCPRALGMQSGRVVLRKRSVDPREMAYAKAMQDEGWLTAAVSVVILDQLEHPCFAMHSHTGQQPQGMMQCYQKSKSIELSVLVSHRPILNRSILPYNNEDVDAEARRSFFKGDDILGKFRMDGAHVNDSCIMTRSEAEHYAETVTDWVGRLYNSSWPSPQTSFANVLKSVLDQLESDLRNGLMPTDLAVLAVSAIVSRVAAVMGVGDTSRIFFTDRQADEVDEIARWSGLADKRLIVLGILGNAMKTREEKLAELLATGFRQIDAERLAVVSESARGNGVPWPTSECMSLTREVVRKAFMFRFEGKTEAYWALLQYYVVFADVMISGR